MVQQLLASVAGSSGLSVIKFLCKDPLKKNFGEKQVGWLQRSLRGKEVWKLRKGIWILTGGQSGKRVV
jgi:hypothetical protein